MSARSSLLWQFAAQIRSLRARAWLGAFALLPAQLSGTDRGAHWEQATSTAAFIDSIGVQTHISYVDTPYANWQQVLDELVRLGVHHVRDALPTAPAFIADHRQLAAVGIRCTCGVTVDEKLTAKEIVSAARAADDVDALEAPNECDAGTNCDGGGKVGIAHAVSALPTLASAAHTLQVPLIGPSFTGSDGYASTGSIAQWVTFNNLHVYFGGRNPGTAGWGAGDPERHRYGSFAWWIDQSKLNAPGVPNQITETGYEAFDNPSRPGTIPVDVESAYLLRDLLLAWNHGIRRTFIYELLDEFPGSGYGLLRHDLSEKPAFTALRDFISLLGASSQKVTPRPLEMTLVAGDPALCHTLLQGGNGSYFLILWLEKSGYDPLTLHTVPVPSENAHVDFGGDFGVRDIVLFNDDGSTVDNTVSNRPSSLNVEVNDRLSVLHIVSR